MVIKEIKNKEVWEEFFSLPKDKTFLDSWNWGLFQEKMGNRIFRLGLFEQNELAAVALVSKVVSKRGTFLLIQHGPTVKEQKGKEKNQKYIILRSLLER